MEEMSVVRDVFLSFYIGVVSMGIIHVSFDVIGVEIVLDVHRSTFEAVVITLIAFTLSCVLIYGIISMVRGRWCPWGGNK